MKIALVIGAATLAGLAAVGTALPDRKTKALGTVGDPVIFVRRAVACNDIHAYTGKDKQREHFCKDWINGGDTGTILQVNERYSAYCINLPDYDSPGSCHWYTDGFTVIKK